MGSKAYATVNMSNMELLNDGVDILRKNFGDIRITRRRKRWNSYE